MTRKSQRLIILTLVAAAATLGLAASAEAQAIMTIKNGKVGINTTDPVFNFDIRSNLAGLAALQVITTDGSTFSTSATFANTSLSGDIAGGIVRISTDQASNPNVVLLNLANAGAEVFKVFNDGRVIIGGLQLTVPDYVFAEDYELMPLPELADFIEREGHLPNIPTAEDVRKNGMNITQLPLDLLEKLEELTLHTIAQQEQIEALQRNLDELSAKGKEQL